MNARTPILTERDHRNLDAFIAHALADLQAGTVSSTQVAGALVDLIAAVENSTTFAQ